MKAILQGQARRAAWSGAVLGAAMLIFSHAAALAGGGGFDSVMASAMARMDSAMAKAPMRGRPDRDFISMMIPHHQGAIDMAKAEVMYGHDPRLIRLAQEIVITQQSEIQVMRLVERDLASKAQKESR